MDAIAEWEAAYARVVGLVSGLSAEEAERPVPATPDWSVRQLLSHMIGLDADVIGGDEPDDHNATWTRAHVEARSEASVADLLDEWEGLAPLLSEWMRRHTTRPLGDVIIHEQDLRGALGEPGGQDTDGIRMLRDRMAGGLGEALADRPPLALVSDTWQWCSSGSAEDAETVLRASEFDLTRALMTRRSEAQLRGWVERGDVEPYLDGFAGLGPLPEADLHE